jgi:glycosyltransferase involved in cell wall biosynthesis
MKYKVQANVMVKNEEFLLKNVLPLWEKYPIDEFVFYNDNSTDNTVEVIKKYLGKRATILENKQQKVFNESHNRSMMLEYSRENKADFVISIDSDELISTNFVHNFEKVLEMNKKYDLQYYWYNVVNGTLSQYRQDPMYKNNYRTFVLPIKSTGKFDMSQWKYHTPRTPSVFLPKTPVREVGFIHLQSLNVKAYALKQLWYKHYEYINYNHSVEFINNRYDPVVNGLCFEEEKTPANIIHGINFSEDINVCFDQISHNKGHREYILENYVKELVTFGEKFLADTGEDNV